MKRAIFLILILALVAACGPTPSQKRKMAVDYTKDRTVYIPPTQQDYQAGEDEDFTGESRFGAGSSYGDAVITVAGKKVKLGRNAGEKEMKMFQKSLDAAYLEAKRVYNPIGFTYSMSPAGSINPLSDMEVQCILSEQSANDKGQVTCDLFFRAIEEAYATALMNAETVQ